MSKKSKLPDLPLKSCGPTSPLINQISPNHTKFTAIFSPFDEGPSTVKICKPSHVRNGSTNSLVQRESIQSKGVSPFRKSMIGNADLSQIRIAPVGQPPKISSRNRITNDKEVNKSKDMLAEPQQPLRTIYKGSQSTA